MFKSFFLFIILVSYLYSSDIKVNHDTEMQNIISSLPSVQNNDILNELGISKNINNGHSKKELLKEEYKKFQFAIEQINDDNFKKMAIDNFNEGMKKLENNEEITIFYFISSESNEQNIRTFMTYIDVLNSHYPNIKGKILLNNYPENLVDVINKSLNFSVEEFVKESGKGTINVDSKGNYSYKVKSINGMTPNDKYQDIFTYKKLDGTTGNIIINLKVDNYSTLKVVGETIVDSMVPYLKNLREKNISSSNVKFHVHPWAFKSLNLNLVPAYVLSYCDNENFRFRDCENKFIAKGNITLEYFIKLIADKNNDYIKYYETLQKGLLNEK